MQMIRDDKICSFCGKPWSAANRFVGGYGAQICRECAQRSHEILSDPSEAERLSATPPWDTMSNEELLDMLPKIVHTAEQVDRFLHDWVGLLRERRISWQQIGLALGVTRQAAWERFTRAKRTEGKPLSQGS